MRYLITYNKCFTSGVLQNFICSTKVSFKTVKAAKNYLLFLEKHNHKPLIPNNGACSYTYHFVCCERL